MYDKIQKLVRYHIQGSLKAKVEKKIVIHYLLQSFIIIIFSSQSIA